MTSRGLTVSREFTSGCISHALFSRFNSAAIKGTARPCRLLWVSFLRLSLTLQLPNQSHRATAQPDSAHPLQSPFSCHPRQGTLDGDFCKRGSAPPRASPPTGRSVGRWEQRGSRWGEKRILREERGRYNGNGPPRPELLSRDSFPLGSLPQTSGPTCLRARCLLAVPNLRPLVFILEVNLDQVPPGEREPVASRTTALTSHHLKEQTPETSRNRWVLGIWFFGE